MTIIAKDAPVIPERQENSYQPDTLTGRKVEALKQKIQKFIDVANTSFLDTTGNTKVEMRLKNLDKETVEGACEHFKSALRIPCDTIDYFYFYMEGNNYQICVQSKSYKVVTTYEIITEDN